MTGYRIKISEQNLDELRESVFRSLPLEAGAFALAGISKIAGSTNILVRRIVSIPQNLFQLQSELRLEVSSQAVSGLASLCQANQLTAVICHSHPKGLSYSVSDDFGERRIYDSLRPFLPKNAPMASLLLSPDGINGRIWTADNKFPSKFDEIIVVGRSINRIKIGMPTDIISRKFDELFDRQITAFGKPGQDKISKMKVGIVGVGGTGSPTAEQLVRLGVRDLVIIDPDVISRSNLTRVYGTFEKHGKLSRWKFPRRKFHKVEVIGHHLSNISQEADLNLVALNVVQSEAASKLFDRDIIFLCTDDHWGRSIVNQISYQYLIPTINLGVSITSEEGSIEQAIGVVDIIRPDRPCLWCREFLNAERIAAESMPREWQRSLLREGYVEDLHDDAPSVISINTAISGLAVNMFIQFATGFMGSSGSVDRLNYNALDGTVRRGKSPILKGCICEKSKGFGDLKELPVVTNVPQH